MKHPDGKRIRFNAIVGDTIRAAREDAGLSRAELETKIGLSTSALSNIEQGVTPCPLFTLARIAHELDLSLDALVPVEANA